MTNGTEIFRNGLAERFGISEIRVVDGIVFVGDAESGGKKWFLPEQAASVADQIVHFAAALKASGHSSDPIFMQACQLASLLNDASKEASKERELSKGTGNKTELVQRELTPLKGHALDWDGKDRKVLEGLVVLGMSLFRNLSEGEIGDVMRMQDSDGEQKFAALKLIDKWKANGKTLSPKQAVSIYEDMKSGRLHVPAGAL